MTLLFYRSETDPERHPAHLDARPGTRELGLQPDEEALPAGAGLHFWRSSSKAEVDFVVSSGKTLVGVEVKGAELGRLSLTRSARSFVEAYTPKTFFVVNRGVEGSQDLGRTAVRWIRPQQLWPSLTELLR